MNRSEACKIIEDIRKHFENTDEMLLGYTAEQIVGACEHSLEGMMPYYTAFRMILESVDWKEKE